MTVPSFSRSTAKRSERTSPPASAWIVINRRADRECTEPRQTSITRSM